MRERKAKREKTGTPASTAGVRRWTIALVFAARPTGSGQGAMNQGTMDMDTDFLDAHRRHWEDAELLYETARWANADHLYGIAAECGLKRLMLAFGMPVKNGEPDHRDRRHVDEIWARYEAYRSGHASGARYALATNVFTDWKAAQRYSHRRHFDQDRDRVQAHRAGADGVRGLIGQAEREGLP
ncbi:SAM-dependent methyltransferase [Azotobacter vinelandii]